jgi:acyl-CoA synthetase (AMP-forming)/AMP-acid ligase II
LIIRGGENIYPFEVENRLEEHELVREVAVFGVDHDILGQEVKAVIVPHEGSTPDTEGLDAEALRAWCAEALASYKVPAYIEVRAEPLPRNATGKVMKHVLAGESGSGFVDEPQ